MDIFFRKKPLGCFAVDVCQPSPDVEKIQELLAEDSHYCVDCKVLQKRNSKTVYRAKCSDAVKAEYQALRSEFVRQSAAMLREFDKSGEAELEKSIWEYLNDMDSKRLELEGKAK